jgi:hypothetical protein
MEFQISDKKKKDVFISIFQVLKNCSSIISCTFEEELLHIQGMDKSHICLFDVKLNKTWFDNYILTEKKIISFDSNMFHSIISTKSDNQSFIFKMDSNNEDTLHIDFITEEKKKNELIEEKEQVNEDENEGVNKQDKKETKKKETKKTETKKKETKKTETKGKNKNDDNKQFKKFFKLPLTENDYSELNIPESEYDAEFALSSKHVDDIFTQLNLFGNDIIVNCSEENIYLTTNGVTGEMRVEIPIDDVSSYSIVEGEQIELTYSLIYLNKMCITNKLSEEVEFSLSSEFPMKILYPLGEDSSISFYMAPKISDD